MAETPKTNPAGRLYHLLKAAGPKGDKKKFGEVWAEVFGIDAKDREQLLVSLSHIYQQMDEGRKLIEAKPDLPQELLLEPFQKLGKAFSVVNLGGQWGGWKRSHLPDGTLRDLQWCAQMLDSHYPESEVDREELSALREDVEQLISKVHKADISAQAKGIILDGLEHVRRSIVEYDLRGADGLKDALEQNLGIIVLRKQELSADSKVWEFVKEWAGKLATLTALVDSAYTGYTALPPESKEAVAGLIEAWVK